MKHLITASIAAIVLASSVSAQASDPCAVWAEDTATYAYHRNEGMPADTMQSYMLLNEEISAIGVDLMEKFWQEAGFLYADQAFLPVGRVYSDALFFCDLVDAS